MKVVVLDPRNGFNVDRTLTKQDVQKLEEVTLLYLYISDEAHSPPAVAFSKSTHGFNHVQTGMQLVLNAAALLETHVRLYTGGIVILST